MISSMRIIVVRHAETEKNFDKRSGSGINIFSKNSDLNHNGIFQAMSLGEYLNMTYHIDAIYTSPALRTLKTTELILQRLETDVYMHVDDRLYNFELAKDKTLLSEAINSLIMTVAEKFGKGDKIKTIVFVTHNHIIDILYNMYINKDFFSETGKKYKVENCSFGSLIFSPVDKCDYIESEFWGKKLLCKYSLTDGSTVE